MNTLKPLAILAVLGGIGYAVYTRVQGDHSHSPLETATPWGAPPSVEITGQPGAPGGGNWTWPPGGTPTSGAPAGGSPAPGGALPPSPFPAPGLAPTNAQPFNQPPIPPPSQVLNPPTGADYGPAGGSLTNPAPYHGNTPPPTGAPAPSPYDTLGGPSNSNPGLARDPSSPTGEMTFAAGFEAGRRQLDDGHLAEGLKQLTVWYDDPRTSPAEQEQLTSLLDQVAGTVIYSTQHLLEPPYTVQPGERLEEIGSRYNVPWQLLAKINGVSDPQSVRAGDMLKVVHGPFMAVINLDKCKLTLMLNGCYAGRFTIGMGRDYPLREGQYAVVEKTPNPTYRGLDRTIDADDPNNPLGERMIGLGSQLGIHGTNDPSTLGPGARTLAAGCVALSPRDVDDLYDILDMGSKVVVRR